MATKNTNPIIEQNYESVLQELASNDDRFICMTAENRALIKNLPAILGNRFIDTGITEQTMVGMAAGLALMGRIPILHALATFLTLRAFEFIRTDVGIANFPVKLTGFISGILSDGNGPTHQALEDISIMRGIPGMQVFAPADEQDMCLMLKTIWKSTAPTYLRANTRKAVYNHSQNFEIGKAEIIAKGSDITILVYGPLFEQAFYAKLLLEKIGKSVGLVNMRTLAPVDDAVVIDVTQNSDLIVIIEDHFKIGGLYTIVAEVLLKNRLTANVFPISFDQKWFRPGLLSEVLEYEGLTSEKIASRIMNYLGENITNIQSKFKIANPEFAE